MFITFENVSFQYNYNLILKNISLKFSSDNVNFIKGKNGTGKTTLLKLIATYLLPFKGIILYDEYSQKVYKEKYSQNIAFISNSSNMFEELTLKENFTYYFNIFNKKFDEKYYFYLKKFNLEKFENMKINIFSLGMKQKANIMLNLCIDYKIYIFDEPFSGLDIESQNYLFEIINNLVTESKMVFLVSHHIERIEKGKNYLLENKIITEI